MYNEYALSIFPRSRFMMCSIKCTYEVNNTIDSLITKNWEYYLNSKY